MSTLGRVGVSVPTPGTTQARETPVDPSAMRIVRLEQKSDADALRDKAFITGTSDTTRPKGSPLTDGITLAAGASIELAHGLGRAAIGFVPVCSGDAVGSLINDVANLSKGLEKTHIRIKNTGAGSVKFKVMVV
jgi:hypothetical protein